MNKYSEHFREARRSLGLTQQQLADRLLLSRNYIAKIEAGSKIPSARVLSTLSGLGQQMLKKSTSYEAALGVAEDRATYGVPESANELRVEAWRQFDVLLQKAGDNAARLGWIIEQTKLHLAPPASWSGSDSDDAGRLTPSSLTQWHLSKQTKGGAPGGPATTRLYKQPQKTAP